MHTHETRFRITDREACLYKNLTEREYREYLVAHERLKRMRWLPPSKIGVEYATALDTVQRAVRKAKRRMVA